MSPKVQLCRLVTAFIVAHPLVGLLSLPTMAQGAESRDRGLDYSDFLLTGADCVVSGDNSNYSRIFDQTESVPIGRQVYTSQFAVEASEYSSLNCSVDPVDFGTLDLQIGVNDNKTARDSRMTVNVYQGSNLKYRYDNVRGGTLINVLLDLNEEVAGGQSNFAIEMVNCQGRGPCRLEFTKAQLLPSNGLSSTAGESPVYQGAPVNTAPSSSPNPASSTTQPSTAPAPTSTRQDDNSSSSRQDSGSGSGNGIGDRIIERTVDGIFDRIFK